MRPILLAFGTATAAVARYFSSFELDKPLAWIYLLLMLVGLIVNMPALLSSQSNRLAVEER